LKITNKEFISRGGGSTRSVLFKIAAAAILDLEKLLPFLYYFTDRHQNLWKHWDFDLEYIDDVGNAYFEKFKMAVIAILNF